MKIDYLTVLMKAPPPLPPVGVAAERGVMISAHASGLDFNTVRNAMGTISHDGRSQRVRAGIYVRHETGAQTDFAQEGLDAYLTLSGVPCEQFRDAGILDKVIHAATKATRFDVAYDYEYQSTNADKLAAMFGREDVTYHEVKHSDTGITHYFGSPRSNKQLALYEYAPPHPRAGYARFEMRYYREDATHALNEYKRLGLRPLAKAGFEWAHMPVPSDIEYGDAATMRTVPRSDGANTLVWIYRQVVPAVHRLHDEGVIVDLEQWLKDTFLK